MLSTSHLIMQSFVPHYCNIYTWRYALLLMCFCESLLFTLQFVFVHYQLDVFNLQLRKWINRCKQKPYNSQQTYTNNVPNLTYDIEDTRTFWNHFLQQIYFFLRVKNIINSLSVSQIDNFLFFPRLGKSYTQRTSVYL